MQINRREAIRRTSILMGGALSATAVAAVMSGCQAPTDPDWTPGYLTQGQAELVAEISERIIPRTDTPGAKDALVHRFIDVYLKDCVEPEDQLKFAAGLEEVEELAKDQFGKAFLKLSDEDKDAVLRTLNVAPEMTSDEDRASELANEGEAAGGALKPGEFFSGIKQLTLMGFFTSEIGATQVLVHDQIPGSYEGCVPYEAGGAAWSM